MALIESFCCIASIKFVICNVFISALELFKLYYLNVLNVIYAMFSTSNPQRLVRQHLVGEYVPIFPTEFLGFRIRRRHNFF